MTSAPEEKGQESALQVIVLGSGGGPLEFNTTALLVRSVAAGWTRGSVIAVDAGVHLAAIYRILQESQPPGLGKEIDTPHVLTEGPFSGLEVPFVNPAANASHISRSLIDAYLITHPHLDHVGGFIINTASPPGARPKRVAGLPATISAIKTHIFNSIIWPNLSDENNGVGLVTYTRLVEGGSPAIGEGDGRGYLELSDGLSVKAFAVSHGHCYERHSHRGSMSSQETSRSRFGSMDGSSIPTPRTLAHTNTLPPQAGPTSNAPTMSRVPSLLSYTTLASQTEGSERICVYDSTAYFIRDVVTGREVLIFGDVEPDSISLSPRNRIIWQEAAPKIVSGALAAVFIECSYDDSQSVDRLYGHLKPSFVIEELKALAEEVEHARQFSVPDSRKRKHDGLEDRGSIIAAGRKRTSSRRPHGDGLLDGESADDAISPKTLRPGRGPQPVPRSDSPHISTPTAELTLQDVEPAPVLPLKGFKVVIIHMKDRLSDGPTIEEIVLSELLAHEEKAKLGCEFIISYSGQSLYL